MKEWHLLLHPEPDIIDKFLSKREKLKSINDREERVKSIYINSYDFNSRNSTISDGSSIKGEYFIPYLFLKNKFDSPIKRVVNKKYDPKMDSKALRNDLHNLIFIHAEKTVIDTILESSWNKDLQNRLRLYWSPEKSRVKVSDYEMKHFINAIKMRDFQYTFGLPLENISNGDKVCIIDGPMEGQMGEIVEKRYDDKGIKLSIAFDMFNNQMRIVIPNFRANDIKLVDNDIDAAPYYEPIISLFEKRLSHLLWLRHGKNGSLEFSSEENRILHSIFRYSDLTFEDNNDAKSRFTALMLICAYLMKDIEAVRKYIAKISDILKGTTTPSTETECYLMTALFIANHDPQVRSAAKSYRQNHPNCSPIICKLQSIAKNIRCR